MKRRTDRRLLVLCLAFLSAGAGLLASGGRRLAQEVETESAAFVRQQAEEELARNYVQEVMAGRVPAVPPRSPEPIQTSAPPPFPKSLQASVSSGTGPFPPDTAWYERDGVTYTPAYAEGTVLGVLSVPAAGICRPVFTGTEEEIRHDLDIWMVTAARPGMVPGRTALVLYGHNHTRQDLSFNRLQPDVGVGDVFTFTAPEGIFEYEVTRVFAMSREAVAEELAGNVSLSPKLCYIVTCGRGEYRYRDFIVEGTCVRVVRPIRLPEGAAGPAGDRLQKK